MENKKMIEKTLLYQDRFAEHPDVCAALSELYAGNRPLSARAYAMKARRLGADVPIPLKCAAENADLDPSGAYLLGQELCHLDRHDEAYPYLAAAGKSPDMSVAPSAALFLADLLSYQRPGDREVIREWYHRAASLGNPDILPVLSKTSNAKNNYQSAVSF